tara:strand:+ start:1231 stop:1587 length:357 start_codon:yes stop_codon:yes gene_type:complete
MALPTFAPPLTPSIGLTDKPEIKVNRADFGDGYSQASPAGLNHIRRVITLKWNVLALDEAQAIEAFFKARRGTDPFTYRIPREASATKWTCEDWNTSRDTGGFVSIEATFRESFDLRT